MQNLIRFTLMLAVVCALLVGCSSGGGKSPVIPTEERINELDNNQTLVGEGDLIDLGRELIGRPSVELSTIGDTYHSLGLMGIWELMIDKESISAELISTRRTTIGESYIVSGASFFTIQPCSDCLTMQSIRLTPENYIQITFSISHPFEKGTTSKPPSATNRLDLDVFDPALVVVPSSATQMNFPLIGARAYTDLCVNVDGFTRELYSLTHKVEVCPYFLVVDNSTGGTSTNNRFPMGTKNTLFDTYFRESGRFDLYVTMGYGASARKATRLNPTYYIPEFNRKAAWKVEVIPPQGSDPPEKGNTWDDTDTTTPYEVTVKVWDWQQNSTVATTYPDPSHTNYIYKASKVSRVSVEIPGMNNSLKYTSTINSGIGSPTDPLVYKIAMANANGLDDGEYSGLVKVSDERVPPTSLIPGQTGSLVHSPDGATLDWYSIQEFATYQVFTATVVVGESVTVTSPNGSEDWEIGQPATITWVTTGVATTNVDIDLSVNSGVSYTVPIASNYANTGSFSLGSVGDWPTEYARVKITNSAIPTITDESDDDFSIICPGLPYPSNINATDGVYYNRVRVTWDAVSGASGYNIYRNNVLVVPNHPTTSWDDMSVTPGVIYNYQLQSRQASCVSPRSPNEQGSACVLPPAPTGLTASDGTYTDRVALSWNAASGATSYNIYRNSVSIQTGVTGTTYNDMTVARGIIYTYEVESQNTCGPSASKSSPNTGYALGCSADTDNSCANATKTYIITGTSGDTFAPDVTGCVDQIDEDWYYFYTSPKGFTTASQIILTIPSGTVNLYVYGYDPGGSCPGSQLHSATGVGSGTITMPSTSTRSKIYVRLVGNSGMVNYTMRINFVAAVTNINAEIYVATTDGTSSGTWPTNGPTPLTHNDLLQMMTWANNWMNGIGYNFVWDGSETFMAAGYYAINNQAEENAMHNTYGRPNNSIIDLYFVDSHFAVNTAFCTVYTPQSAHNINNVYTVYMPQVWSWQNVIDHEHGHAIGYLQDQYLYDQAPCAHCACGDDVCLSACLGTQYLFSVTNGCYNGNQMYFANPAQPWSWYTLRCPQRSYIHEFNFINNTNFPWY